MSEHRYSPVTADELELADLITTGFGIAPTGLRREGDALVVIFVPDLTPTQAATLDALAARWLAARRTRELGLTYAEYQSIEDDIAGLRTYYGLASPTNAQSVAAIKAIIRVLRAVLRD